MAGINQEACLNIRRANYCGMCARLGEEGCPLLNENRGGERRLFDRRKGYRRLKDEGMEARAC